MATIGFAKPYIAKLINEAQLQYADCFVAGKGIGLEINPQYAEAKLYGDNRTTDQRKDFKEADVKLNTTNIPAAGCNTMFGHEVVTHDDGNKEIIYKDNDVANYCGCGAYATETIDGVDKQVAIIINKVKFSEDSEAYATKGDNVEYKTPTINGKAVAPTGHTWKRNRVFDTEAEAEQWIQTSLGYMAKCAEPAASVQGGSYETSQTVTLTADEGTTIYYTTNGTTPSTENGTQYTSAIAVTASLAIKAIAIKTGCVSSDVVTYEYLIG